MEQNEYATGTIHKLFVGNNLTTYYEVGSPNKPLDSTIVEIVEDVNYLVDHGITRHLIILENSKKERWLWATPTGLPFLVQYTNPKNNPENIK